MALYDGSTYYTKFTFTENGKTIDRRIHRIEIQAKDGRLYIIEGKDLPDFLYASTGVGFKGQHIVEILLPRKTYRSAVPFSVRPIYAPDRRDVVYLVTGIVLPTMASAMLTLLAAAF